jgi:hypothetical protein
VSSLVRPVLLGLLAAVAVVSSGDQGAPPPAPVPAPPSPVAPAPPSGDIEDFVPSEKVSADDAVAFPVDI